MRIGERPERSYRGQGHGEEIEGDEGRTVQRGGKRRETHKAYDIRTYLQSVQGLVCLVTHKENLPETPCS
jgi:hypothetical protein